ncbi:transcriptional regulator [Sinomicrobium pectinilyticum]|uniref:Transcriptional regulator n=1 Tax=Sinomicrobium pectinilyticum TaxID=1084421 RepID=A0A3N0ETX1_SINP1|nr:helix-turn-helix domain-containing protein [Sinomicrobium pectinilyticum]RNL91350.1 transcriptional regulator [Sinomicrobium pectinilyticum]
MKPEKVSPRKEQFKECINSLYPIRDALEVIGGKWRIQILIAIRTGNHRFTAIERAIGDISPRILSKELKILQENRLIVREVSNTYPVVITYKWSAHADSITPIITVLNDWGIHHRKFLFGK